MHVPDIFLFLSDKKTSHIPAFSLAVLLYKVFRLKLPEYLNGMFTPYVPRRPVRYVVKELDIIGFHHSLLYKCLENISFINAVLMIVINYMWKLCNVNFVIGESKFHISIYISKNKSNNCWRGVSSEEKPRERRIAES